MTYFKKPKNALQRKRACQGYRRGLVQEDEEKMFLDVKSKMWTEQSTAYKYIPLSLKLQKLGQHSSNLFLVACRPNRLF
jgi:hypothetical protein